jgi:hypothetical protein
VRVETFAAYFIADIYNKFSQLIYSQLVSLIIFLVPVYKLAINL